MPAYESTRTVAIGILTRTIMDGETLVPEGSTVFITRTAYIAESTHSLASTVYACVAEVAVNGDGVCVGWRIHVPINAVSVKSRRLLRDVALNWDQVIAEACEDEANAG